MRRVLIAVIVVAAVGLVLSVAGLILTVQRRPSPGGPYVLQPDPAVAGLSIPDFALTDQNGRTRTQEMLDGKVTILDFIFTNCPFACPQMAMAMNEMADALAKEGVQFVSMSVDPEHDTPERLLQYANQIGADQSRWTFMTGPEGAVGTIVRGGLKFALQPDDTRPITTSDGSSMLNIVHPTRLILVGPDRRILGMFDPNSDEDMRLLEARARIAARALPAR